MSKPIKWILIFKFGEQMNISLNYATSLFMLKKERKKSQIIYVILHSQIIIFLCSVLFEY